MIEIVYAALIKRIEPFLGLPRGKFCQLHVRVLQLLQAGRSWRLARLCRRRLERQTSRRRHVLELVQAELAANGLRQKRRPVMDRLPRHGYDPLTENALE